VLNGPKTVGFWCGQDPHCHLTPARLAAADLLICFKVAPGGNAILTRPCIFL
jgi:microcystin degradation protein MlrC